MTYEEALKNTRIVVGEEYIFNYPTEFVTLPDYTEHRLQKVRVVSHLDTEEYDFEGELMFTIRAEDGWIGQACEFELVEAFQSPHKMEA